VYQLGLCSKALSKTTGQPASKCTFEIRTSRNRCRSSPRSTAMFSALQWTKNTRRWVGELDVGKGKQLFNPLNVELNPICHLLILLGDLTFMGLCILSIFQYISNKMQRYTVYLYLETALHVSDGPSVHHQESKTVHTASGICQTGSADCLLAGTRWNCSSIRLRPLMMDGKTVRNM
jgi:hypothetical protein